MCRRRAAVLVLALLAAAWPSSRARAEESPEALAERLAALHAEGGDAAVAGVVSRGGVEPWRALEALLATGRLDVARSWAGSWREGVAGALARYLAWREEHPIASAVAEADRAVRQLARRGDARGAVALLEGEALADEGVLGIVLRIQRAGALERIRGAREPILTAYREAADLASRHGWSEAVAQALGAAMRVARDGEAHEEVLGLGRALLAAVPHVPQRDQWLARRRMAVAAHRMRRTPEAIEHAEAALALAATPAEEREGLYQVLLVAHDALSLERRLALQTRLLALEEARGDARGIAATQVRLGSSEVLAGRWTQGAARLEAGVAFFDAHGTPGERRGAHKNAAVAALEMQDDERAAQHVATARAIDPAAADRDVDLRVMEVVLEARHGSPDTVRRLVESTVALGPEHVRPADVQLLHDLSALAASRAGDVEAASRALAASDRARSGDHGPHDELRHLSLQAVVALQAGRVEEAIDLADRARALARRHALTRATSLLDTWLALAWLRRGEPEKALACAERGIGSVVARSATLPERRGWLYRAKETHLFRAAVEAAARLGEAERFFHVAELARAVALRQRLGEGDGPVDVGGPGHAARDGVLRQAEAEAVEALRRAVGVEPTRAALRALDAVRAQREALDERLRLAHAAAGQLVAPRVVSLGDVRASLRPGEAQVHMAHGLDRVWALVVTPAETRLVDLGPEDLVRDRLDDVVVEDVHVDPAPAVAALAAVLVAPLELAGVRTLTLVPAGRLAMLPVGLLWPDTDVRLVPSSTIGQILGAREEADASGRLVVADPVHPGLAPLPAAAGDVVDAERRLVGPAATEAALAQALVERRWRVVHVACHGQIDPERPLRSALALAPTDASDGLWTVAEILRARVRADLVVLAACSSGQARAYEQEGRAGFVHAFFVAGARSVVVGLWDVDDEATSKLMRAFHHQLEAGADAPAALRAAQAELRRDPRFAHPAHWAGWQVWGPGSGR
ncbi:MAG: CHAT domain-containing protein [Planctomycetota bacterium]